jgi:hypothetical protein
MGSLQAYKISKKDLEEIKDLVVKRGYIPAYADADLNQIVTIIHYTLDFLKTQRRQDINIETEVV